MSELKLPWYIKLLRAWHHIQCKIFAKIWRDKYMKEFWRLHNETGEDTGVEQYDNI